jgi:hypothetical protein
MPPTARAVCCVVTRNYCPFLIATYLSILEHNDLPLYVLVVDIEPPERAATADALRSCLPPRARNWIHVVGLDDVFPGNVESLRFYYDGLELSMAGKAALHHWMDAATGIECWLYLDADILCFGALDPLFDSLGAQGTLLLTPHCPHPPKSMAQNLRFLSAGCFNAGVVGVRRSAEASRFARWYRDMLTHFSLNDLSLPPASRFFHGTVLVSDQRWLDLVPGYFDGVVVARRRGFNLGHWNIGEDRLRRAGDGLYAGDEQVVLLHLSGWRRADPGRFSSYSKHDFAADDAWRRIHSGYRRQLEALDNRFPTAYRYASYPDGTPIPKAHRRAYLRHLAEGNPPLPSPFAMKDHFERLASAA